MTFDFLPSWPPAVNTMLIFGGILLVGLAGGELAARTRLLPRITGYILIGMLLGPGGLALLNPEMLAVSRLVIDISLGLILFELGRRLDFGWLRRDRGLLPSGLAEAVLAFLLVFFVLIAFDVAPLAAALAAAVGMATSPAVVLMVVHELGAQGPVTRRALTLVAINNVLALVMVTILLPYVHMELRSPWLTVVTHPLYLLAGSLVLGAAAHLLLLGVARLVGKREAAHFVLQVAVILMVVGLARSLALSGLLAVLMLGILARNADPRHRLMEVEFGYGGLLFFVPLFVITGASLDLRAFAVTWEAALAFALARFLGKSIGLFVFAPASGLRPVQAAQLALAMTPMAALAIGLTWSIADLSPELGAQLVAVVVAAVTLLHLLGPIATQAALKWAREDTPGAGR